MFVYLCMYMCMLVNMHVNIYIYIHIYIYIYLYIPWPFWPEPKCAGREVVHTLLSPLMVAADVLVKLATTVD